eukprot:TRINITY_DN513_c0_g1_i5.p1 TRINITY_DN513_c0_g1~~TRINITY_DN513_c0_g1_i5.p1  ORF type:complete len:353 (-),score=98.26 TRINITY_DN513_c0_g1_i5:268-1326(-)
MEKKLQTPPQQQLQSQALVCHGHSRPIVDLSYSPITDDGFFLISASKDGKPMLRNGETGDWIGTFEGHKGAVWGATLDTPALRAATASADFSARVWDALTGDELHLFEHKHIVRTIDFSASTKRLLTGGAEKLLRVFDLERPDAAPLIIEGMGTSIRCAAWHANDNVILATSSDSPNVRVWDVRSKEVVQQLETECSCTSVEITRGDGHRYIVTADGQDMKIWDAENYMLAHSFRLKQKVESASLLPTPLGRFVTGGDDMWVRLFDLDTGAELECNKGHHGPVHCVRFAPDGQSYASGSEDGTIRIWRLAPSSSAASTAAAAAVRVSAEVVEKKVEGFHVPLASQWMVEGGK